jgi:hypothetical protein
MIRATRPASPNVGACIELEMARNESFPFGDTTVADRDVSG